MGLINHRPRNQNLIFLLSLISFIIIFVDVVFNAVKPDNVKLCDCVVRGTFTFFIALMGNIYVLSPSNLQNMTSRHGAWKKNTVRQVSDPLTNLLRKCQPCQWNLLMPVSEITKSIKCSLKDLSSRSTLLFKSWTDSSALRKFYRLQAVRLQKLDKPSPFEHCRREGSHLSYLAIHLLALSLSSVLILHLWVVLSLFNWLFVERAAASYKESMVAVIVASKQVMLR